MKTWERNSSLITVHAVPVEKRSESTNTLEDLYMKIFGFQVWHSQLTLFVHVFCCITAKSGEFADARNVLTVLCVASR